MQTNYSNSLLFSASPRSARLDSHSTSEQHNSSELPDGACPDRQWPQCLLSLALILQTLGSALLALAHSLVMLTVGTKCRHSSGICTFLPLQDPSLSSLAVIMLTAVAMLQVRPERDNKRLWLLWSQQLCNWLFPPGAQVRAAAAAGHAPQRLRVWPRSEDPERPRGAGRPRPPHLAAERIRDGGVRPRALPRWVCSYQVSRDAVWSLNMNRCMCDKFLLIVNLDYFGCGQAIFELSQVNLVLTCDESDINKVDLYWFLCNKEKGISCGCTSPPVTFFFFFSSFF